LADREKLRQRVADLRAEIAKLEDGERRKQLEAIADRIDLLLGEPVEVDVEALLEDLEAQLLQFEASHPRIAFLLNDLMEILANLGI